MKQKKKEKTLVIRSSLNYKDNKAYIGDYLFAEWTVYKSSYFVFSKIQSEITKNPIKTIEKHFKIFCEKLNK